MHRDWAAYERQHGYIQVRFRLATTEEGGRKGPVSSDYRASWDIGSTDDGEWMLNDAPIVFEDVEKIDPGEEAVARIHPVSPEYWEHVRTGTQIYAHEGRRRVGEAVVTARSTELKPP